MGRRAFYRKCEVPYTVVMIVNSICADYERRKKAISNSMTSPIVKDVFIELNKIVDSAFEEIEPGIRNDMFSDIIVGRGYGKSRCNLIMCKDAYYKRRRKIVYNIAVNMNIINQDKTQ